MQMKKRINSTFFVNYATGQRRAEDVKLNGASEKILT